MPIRRFGARKDSSRYGKRHIPGVMNQTEEAYAELLQARKLAGDIIDWGFECVTFKIAKDCRYTPDFYVFYPDGSMEFVDAKGGGPIDPKSIVKIKAAADKFFQFQFATAQKLAKKNGGGWQRIEY